LDQALLCYTERDRRYGRSHEEGSEAC